MPVYDYRCGGCGRQVEVIHGIYEVGPRTCDACGGPMRKALTSPAIHFKGSGWAKKDAQATTRAKPTTDTAAEPKPASAGTGESQPGGASDRGTPASNSSDAGAGDGAGDGAAGSSTKVSKGSTAA